MGDHKSDPSWFFSVPPYGCHILSSNRSRPPFSVSLLTYYSHQFLSLDDLSSRNCVIKQSKSKLTVYRCPQLTSFLHTLSSSLSFHSLSRCVMGLYECRSLCSPICSDRILNSWGPHVLLFPEECRSNVVLSRYPVPWIQTSLKYLVHRMNFRGKLSLYQWPHINP